MSFGLTSGVTVNRQSLSGSIIRKFTERADAATITRVSHAIGLVRANPALVRVFKNFNYEVPLLIVEPVNDGDIIDVIDKTILVQQCYSMLSIDNLRAAANRTKGLIANYKARIESGENLESDLACLEKILIAQEAELLQARIDAGQISDDPLVLSLVGFMPPGVVPEPIGTEPGSSQTVYVTWDAVNRYVDFGPFMGTGPSDTVDINLTIITDDGLPLESSAMVEIVVDGGTMTEGVQYTLTNFAFVVPAGTPNGTVFTATYEAYGNEGGPDDSTLTLTAVDAIPVATLGHPLTVIWQSVV